MEDGRARDWFLAGGGVTGSDACSVLVEGECWEERTTTVNRANQELHQLGFPPFGLTGLLCSDIKVDIETEVSVSYCPPMVAHGIVCRRLCIDASDLPSYETAVLGLDSL